jgi:hypothetical protein
MALSDIQAVVAAIDAVRTAHTARDQLVEATESDVRVMTLGGGFADIQRTVGTFAFHPLAGTAGRVFIAEGEDELFAWVHIRREKIADP